MVFLLVGRVREKRCECKYKKAQQKEEEMQYREKMLQWKDASDVVAHTASVIFRPV